MQEKDGLGRRLGNTGVLLAQPGKRWAVIAPNGDEESLGVEAVHLHKAVVVIGRGAVDHEERQVVVVLQLGPLVEVLGIFQGQGMKTEHLGEEGRILGAHRVEIQPEEGAGRQVIDNRGAMGHQGLARRAVKCGEAHHASVPMPAGSSGRGALSIVHHDRHATSSTTG